MAIRDLIARITGTQPTDGRVRMDEGDAVRRPFEDEAARAWRDPSVFVEAAQQAVSGVVGNERGYQERRAQLAEKQKEAQAIVSGARTAAGRAREVAERVVGQAAEQAQPFIPKPTRRKSEPKGPVRLSDRRPFGPDEGFEPRPALVEGQPLPGEEQVTTAQTLATLPPEISGGLRAKYEGGGHAENMTFDDWLSENFADYAPDERAAMMRQSATAETQNQIGRDPTLEPGQMTGVAKGVRASGRPLPEGRPAAHYSPDQTRMQGRNVYDPSVRTTPFGGSFAATSAGSYGMRAPRQDAPAIAATIDTKPEELTLNEIIALAPEYGIDAAAYGDDLDLLAKHTIEAHRRHQTQSQVSDTVPTGMGGFRYTPNEATREQDNLRNAQRFARTLVERYGKDRMPGFDAKAVNAAGEAGDMNALRAINREFGGLAAADRQNNARDRAASINMTRDLNNPAIRQGMLVRGLMRQVAEKNPEGMAAMSQIAGDPRTAAVYAQLAAQQQQMLADATEADEARRAAADAAEKERRAPMLSAELIFEELANEPDPAVRYRKALMHATAVQQATLPEGAPLDQTAAARDAAILVASQELREARASGDAAAAEQVFARFAGDQAAFSQLADMAGVPPRDRTAMWNRIAGTTAEQRGAAIAQGVSDIGSGIKGFVRGLFGEGE